MAQHHKSKKTSRKSKKPRQKHHHHERSLDRSERLEKKIQHLREISIIFDETDDMADISQSIIDLHTLLKSYRDNIRFIEENESSVIDRAYYELEVAEKLDILKSKADTVYLFTTDYMKKNLSFMTRELGNVIEEYEDYVEAKNKDHFFYYIPLLNKYLYEKEKGELIDAISHIEDLYVNNMRMVIDLHEEVKEIMVDLDEYYGIEDRECILG